MITTKTKTILILLLGALTLVTLPPVAQAETVRGANTKLEADRIVSGLWEVSLYTRISYQRQEMVRMRAETKLGNSVLRLFQYRGSRVSTTPLFWPGKKKRIYTYLVDARKLPKVKASLVRKFFAATGSKPVVQVSIGSARGKVTLNV